MYGEDTLRLVINSRKGEENMVVCGVGLDKIVTFIHFKKEGSWHG